MGNLKTPNPQFFDSDVPLEPTRLRQGDSWAWLRSFGELTSDLYSLSYILNSASNRFVFPSGTISPDGPSLGFDIEVTAAQSAACVPDVYQIIAILTGRAGTAAEGDRQTLELQRVVVDPDLAGATSPIDTRTFNQQMLDMIRAALLGDTRPDVQEYMVNGRQLRKFTHKELEEQQALYIYRVDCEKRARGEYVAPRTIGVRFKPAV